jgi:hypothetical protein
MTEDSQSDSVQAKAGAEAEHANHEPAAKSASGAHPEEPGLAKSVIRYVITLAVVLLLQLGAEKLIFGEIGPDPAFERDVVSALQGLDPFELGKLWGEALGFNESVSSTPEYAACMARPGADAGICIGESEEKRMSVRVYPDSTFGWFPASLVKATWNVIAYQFQDGQPPAYRLVALCQIIVGFGFMTAIMAALMRFKRFQNTHPIILLVLYTVGCFAFSSLLAWPLRLLALALSAKITTGIYAATTVRALDKSVDALMHRSLDRALEAAWR